MHRAVRIRRVPISLTTAQQSSRSFTVAPFRMADDKSALDKDGSVGKEFKSNGSIGGTAQKVGGPFDKDGAIGKQFKESGAVGGTAQDAAEQAQGDKPSVFDKDGAIGRQFQADGNIGKVGEAVGGPFSKDGAIGKQFTDKGSIGGTVQENLGDDKK